MPSTATTRTVTGLTNGTAYQFRVAGVNGIGTGAFSTASAAVTPTAGDPFFSSVSLLLNGDGNFTDLSSNNTSITSYGNVNATGSAKYGSGALTFDGSGDYLGMSGSQFAFGTADFTMEAWLWVDSHNNGWRTIMGASTDPPTSVVAPRIILSAGGAGETTNGLKLDVWDGSTATAIRDSVAFPTGQWVHIALVRQSGTARLYKGGVQVGSTSMTRELARDQFFVGRGYDNVDGEYFAGRIDDLRVTKGVCRYPDGTTFTPPTAAFPTVDQNGNRPDAYFSNVSLLLPFNGNLTDASSSPKTMTAFGNAAATGVAKFGSASLALDGTGDYLTTPSTTDFDLPGDFCIEAWVRLTAPPSSFAGSYGAAVVSRYSGATDGYNKGYQLRINGTASEYDTINFYTGLTDLNFSTAVALNTWHHLAVARAGSSVRAYLNGSQVGSTVTNSDSLTPTSSRSLSIGRLALETVYLFDLPGQIDDLRITKGSARGYTGATITVPTAAFPTS